MRRIVWLVVLAIPVIVLVTLPARMVVSWVDVPDGLGQVQGSIWSGRAQWRQPGQAPLALSWRWAGGRHWQWQAMDADTDLAGRWSPSAGGVRLERVQGRLDLDRVDLAYWLINARPRGHLEVDIERAWLARGQPPQVDGDVIWREAALEGAIHESLGEVGLRLSGRSGEQRVRVESLRPASVQVNGHIELEADRYRVDLRLRASADRPDLVSQLARLGEMQDDGQVHMQLGGRTGW